MRTLVNRPFTEYAKSIAARCEQLCALQSIPASVYYAGYLDALNNEGCISFFLNDPNPIMIVVINDFLDNIHLRANMARIASIPKQFIFVTEVSNAQADFEVYPNIQYVNMGPNLLAYHDPWAKVFPQNYKNLISGEHWISLNNNARPQRTLVSSIIANYNLGLPPDNIGMMRINIDNHGARLPINNFDEWMGWLQLHYPYNINIIPGKEEKLRRGYARLEQLRNIPIESAPYLPGFPRSLDNPSNFNHSLRSLYNSAVIEIVNETVFFNKGIVVSEKYLYTVLGFVFPIIIGNPGTVHYLRQLGFDMFDDIVNHDYDSMSDPIERAFLAIEDNLHLLSNPDLAREKWLQCYTRFEKNYHLVKHELKLKCLATFEAEFHAAINKLK